MKKIILLLSLFLIPLTANAKIGDSPPIKEGFIVYRSHENYVEAIDSRSKKKLWRKYLYKNFVPEHYKPGLEWDVQWHIVHLIKIEGSVIEAEGNNHTYWLNKSNGKVLKTK